MGFLDSYKRLERLCRDVMDDDRRVSAYIDEMIRLTDGSGRVSAAGKTGTAQQSLSAPNHALFLGYAPVDDPEIAIAVCIPNGYSSSYAALVASQVMQYYFDPDSLSGILSSNDIPNYTNGD
jgi:hypothetical protein